MTLKLHPLGGLRERWHAFWNRFAPSLPVSGAVGMEAQVFKYLQGRRMDGEKRYTQPLDRRLGVSIFAPMTPLIFA